MTERPLIAPSRGGTRVLSPAEMLAFLEQNVRVNEDGCHEWAGTTIRKDGWPTVNWGGVRYNARLLLFRLCEIAVRPGWFVFPTCGNKRCMLREHLRAGTKRQVMQNASRVGRIAHGTRHALAIAAGRAATAKMPMSERFNVARMRADGWTWARIAEHYGVHLSCPQKMLRAWEKRFGPAAYWSRGDERMAA